MDSINHVKLVTPDPVAVNRFLTEVVDLPAGWSIGRPGEGPMDPQPSGTALLPDGTLSWDSVHEFRASNGSGGYIVGSPRSGQLQVFGADRAHVWAIAIGTRDVERAYERAMARGIPCTEIRFVPWGEDDVHITVFFAEVGGIIFEIMRVEPAGTPPPAAAIVVD